MSGSWRFRRLNDDASWWVDVGPLRCVFDPWLVGSEIDFGRWFNEQWHVGPVVAPSELPPHELVLVTQRYPDHCHEETLRALPDHVTLAVVPDAVVKVRKARPDLPLVVIPTFEQPPLHVQGVRIWRLTTPLWRPPRYHAVMVQVPDGRTLVHAPHGLTVREASTIAARCDVRLLAITRQWFKLPFFLGGAVNPGPEAARRAARLLRPQACFAIHDEPKVGVGLVGHIAKVDRPSLQATDPSIPWVALPAGTTGLLD